MNIKLLGNRVMILQDKVEETTSSGIILATSEVGEKKARGTVIQVGSGEKVSALGLIPGDVILFGKYDGYDIEFDNEEYKILNDENIIGILA